MTRAHQYVPPADRQPLRIACIPNPTRRVSPDSAWPLRGADGLTWAERKQKESAHG